MIRATFFILIILIFPSCFLFKDYKRREFSFIRMGDSSSSNVPIIVPKGYKRQVRINDSLGHQGITYQYKSGAELYILYAPLGDNYQAFDTVGHIPHSHLQGGIFYKGIDSTKRWWREAQPPFFRIGYRHVPSDVEALFDSAVNYPKPAIRTPALTPGP